MTPVCDDAERRSIYHNFQLLIRSKTAILNMATFKYSLHKFCETILQRKYKLI